MNRFDVYELDYLERREKADAYSLSYLGEDFRCVVRQDSA